jgi:hypothetical protein
MTKQTRQRDPYPYPLPGLSPLEPETVKNVNPWAVLEFLRIEALLRSKTVMELYRSEGPRLESGVKLMLRYRVNWSVLEGSHHRYLDAPSSLETAAPGIWLLSLNNLMWLAGALSSLTEKESSDRQESFFHWVRNEMLWLCIDGSLPPDLVIKALRPILAQRSKATRESSWKPTQVDFLAWLDHFRCYDLRFRDGYSYEDIGQTVYLLAPEAGGPDRAKKAVMAIRRLIDTAEQNAWPPAML